MGYIFYSDKPPQSSTIALGWMAYGERGRLAYSEKKERSGAEIYSFKLQSIPPTYERRDSAIFYGTIKPHEKGSIIEGHFRIPCWYKIFLGVLVLPWYAFSGPLFVISLIDILEGRGTPDSLCVLAILLFPIIGSTVFVVGTIYNIRREERRVADMLFNLFPKAAADVAQNQPS